MATKHGIVTEITDYGASDLVCRFSRMHSETKVISEDLFFATVFLMTSSCFLWVISAIMHQPETTLLHSVQSGTSKMQTQKYELLESTKPKVVIRGRQIFA